MASNDKDEIPFTVVQRYTSPEVSQEYYLVLARDPKGQSYFIVEHGNKYGILRSWHCKTKKQVDDLIKKLIGDRL